MHWFDACPYVPPPATPDPTYAGTFGPTSGSCGGAYNANSDTWGLPGFNDKFITFYIKPGVDLRDFKSRTTVEFYLERPEDYFSEVYVPTEEYWAEVTQDWPFMVPGGELITVTLQVSSGNFVMESYPYSLLDLSSGSQIIVTQVRLRNELFGYGPQNLEDLVFSSSKPAQVIPAGPAEEPFFPITCPFFPIENLSCEDNKPAEFVDTSCPLVELFTGGGWGSGEFAIPNMFGGTVEITVTPGSVNEFGLYRLTSYLINFGMASPDGYTKGEFFVSYNEESEYCTVYDPPAPYPLAPGSTFTFRIDTSKLVESDNFYTGEVVPIPQDGSLSVLTGVSILAPEGAEGCLDGAWTLVGLNFIPNAPSANIFWTRNKGCTEVP